MDASCWDGGRELIGLAVRDGKCKCSPNANGPCQLGIVSLPSNQMCLLTWFDVIQASILGEGGRQPE